MDPNDMQPQDEIEYIGLIRRTDVDPNLFLLAGGVMEMRTQAPGRSSASSVSAKGAFARAGDEDIMIEFEYMFRADPKEDAELIVYLSDDPEVGHKLRKVAVIRPPEFGRPGSVGSDKFAVFSGTFSRGELNFNRGTYVELELRGEGARCWIDNWDPQVYCLTICGDYNLDTRVLVDDHITLVAEFGLSGPKGCLDLVEDGIVNADDLMAWNTDEIFNRCTRRMQEEGLLSSDQMVAREPLSPIRLLSVLDAQESSPLLICGKSSTSSGSHVPSYLYSLGGNAWHMDEETASDGRLVVDGNDEVYQIHGVLGLVELDSGAAVVERNVLEPKDPDYAGSMVTVGMHGATGCLLTDAVFHPDHNDIVYLVPVEVDPQDGNCPYMAAAKLQVTGEGRYDIVKLYGKNPARESSRFPRDSKRIVHFTYDPDHYHLREVEIDSQGESLFVLSSILGEEANNNNWLLMYDEGEGNDSQVPVLLSDPCNTDPDILGPTAMVVSSRDEVYLASSVIDRNDPNGLATEVYCFSVARDSNGKPRGLAYADTITIDCPEPDMGICRINNTWCESNRFVSAITAMTEDPANGTLYVTGFIAPKFKEDALIQIAGDQDISGFPTPILAVFRPDVDAPVDAITIEGCSLRLPLSTAWTGIDSPAAQLP